MCVCVCVCVCVCLCVHVHVGSVRSYMHKQIHQYFNLYHHRNKYICAQTHYATKLYKYKIEGRKAWKQCYILGECTALWGASVSSNAMQCHLIEHCKNIWVTSTIFWSSQLHACCVRDTLQNFKGGYHSHSESECS